jgi:hypothetical protein
MPPTDVEVSVIARDTEANPTATTPDAIGVSVERFQVNASYAILDESNTSAQLAAIDAYLADTPITAAEANRRLRVQGRFNHIVANVADAIAVGDFAGTWIDDGHEGRGGSDAGRHISRTGGQGDRRRQAVDRCRGR